eukprot:EC822294.1.p1 GENE.EC822294.1~~EC822294.1.p1  ORF type:complete len:201 (+),score=76.95 EC822294.1:1-603(+)
MNTISNLVDLSDKWLYLAVISIIFSPLTWSVFQRIEYNTKFLTKFFGNKYKACYAFAFWVWCWSMFRDYAAGKACFNQPRYDWMSNIFVVALGYITGIVGYVLVAATYFRLGVTGTYAGDYFGILFNERIVGFPFNYFNNPMYFGAVLNFLSGAILARSIVGVFLSLEVALVYKIVLYFEEPFTGYIYAKREEERKLKKN